MRAEERQAFIRAVCATPDDDLPRLIFADRFDEDGDPLGEFIRVQCELARADDSWQPPAGMSPASARDALRRRERELLARNWDGWHYEGELTGAVFCENLSTDTQPCPTPWIRFHRGFVSEIALPWDGRGWLANCQAILDSCPIRRVNRPMKRVQHVIGCQCTREQVRPACFEQITESWRGDGLVRLTTWPEWEGDSRGDEYLRLHGCKRWHRIPFGRSANGSARATIVGKLLAAEWPRLTFDLSQLPRDGFDFDQPGGSSTITGDMTWEPNVREWLDAHTTA